MTITLNSNSVLTSTNSNSQMLTQTSLPFKALASKHYSRPDYDGSVKPYLLIQHVQHEYVNSFQEINQHLWQSLEGKLLLYLGQSYFHLIHSQNAVGARVCVNVYVHIVKELVQIIVDAFHRACIYLFFHSYCLSVVSSKILVYVLRKDWEKNVSLQIFYSE